MQEGDILTAEEARYIEQLEGLWDMVSDMVEGGRLREGDIPDDYAALLHQMDKVKGASFQENRVARGGY